MSSNRCRRLHVDELLDSRAAAERAWVSRDAALERPTIPDADFTVDPSMATREAGILARDLGPGSLVLVIHPALGI